MDSTKLFRTGHTVDQTQLYLDRSSPSRGIVFASGVLPPRFEQSTVQVKSLTLEDQVQVYCPVCMKNYSNYQAEQHAALHDATPFYNFRVQNRAGANRTILLPNQISSSSAKPVASLNPSDNSTNLSSSTVSSGNFQYPMIEPLQFWTNQLNDSAKSDIFIVQDNKNYDNVDHSIFNPPAPVAPVVPVTPPVVTPTKPTYFDFHTQTFTKPPLQYQSNNTNLYNCLDNAVNGKNGPKFSMKDVFANNQIITPKRMLDDWEVMQKNQNQTRAAMRRG